MSDSLSTRADGNLISWLLHDSQISNAEISRKTNISEATISRIKQGTTNLNSIKFGYAIKLTQYAKFLRGEEDSSNG